MVREHIFRVGVWFDRKGKHEFGTGLVVTRLANSVGLGSEHESTICVARLENLLGLGLGTVGVECHVGLDEVGEGSSQNKLLFLRTHERVIAIVARQFCHRAEQILPKISTKNNKINNI